MEIQLPGFVIAELFKDDLVIITPNKNTEAPIEKPLKDNEINATKTNNNSPEKKFWLGENNRNIVIITEDTNNVFTDENALQFLTNILSACKFNLSDVAIVNTAHTKMNYEAITKALNSKYVLLFGISEEKISLGAKLNLFENKLLNNTQLLSAPPLESLMLPNAEAKTSKSKLWNGLKKMFGL
ncbi:MAG TPA: hypothetical protein VGB84_06565 [Arachidicoccus sp.]